MLFLSVGVSQVLRLVVGNHESTTNPFPAEERAETLVVCARPASLLLAPLYHPVGLGRPCPLTQQKRQLVGTPALAEPARPTRLQLLLYNPLSQSL